MGKCTGPGVGSCNAIGICVCKAGFVGERCSECATGYIRGDVLCVQDPCAVQPGHTSPRITCGDHGTCNNDARNLPDGSCSCGTGWTTNANDRNYCESCAQFYKEVTRNGRKE